MLFTTIDATTGTQVLRPRLPLNRTCLHLGSRYMRGVESLFQELARLEVGQSFTLTDPFSGQKIAIRREE